MRCLFLSLLLFSCDTLPVDTSPDWPSNNRYAVEQKLDCNTTNLVIGLAGCAFFDNQLAGNLTLPSFWSGLLTFQSYNCDSFTQQAFIDRDNILPIKQLYTATNKENCSFQITRTVTDNNMTADSPMIGRFFIKIIPSNKNYSKLKFSVNNNKFEGVGWHQRQYGKPDAQLHISTLDKNGTFIMRCGNDEVKRINYTSSDFFVDIDSDINCDYEMAAYSASLPWQEFGTYIHEVNDYVSNISVPKVLIKRNKITFEFTDKDVSGKDPVVFAVQVENTKCTETNKCSVINNKSQYTVKAVTPSLRLFYAIYHVNGTWEVK